MPTEWQWHQKALAHVKNILPLLDPALKAEVRRIQKPFDGGTKEGYETLALVFRRHGEQKILWDVEIEQSDEFIATKLVGIIIDKHKAYVLQNQP